MPVIARQQATTTEERLDKVLEIINKIPNKLDSDFLKLFVLEICQRYTDKIDEISRLNVLSDALTAMNKFEIDYIKRIVENFKNS